jgi:hypothetical protein
MTDSPLIAYLSKLGSKAAVVGTGKETTHYGALTELLESVGASLKPKIIPIQHPPDVGAGVPDFGLYSADQVKRAQKDVSKTNADYHQHLSKELPAVGVVEVKSPADDAWLTVDGPQVTKYWGKYGLVLVTNLRDFLLLGRDVNGNPAKLESFRLAKSVDDFWDNIVAHPQKASKQIEERLVQYLRRVMLHRARITSPQDLAAYLASYARDARARVDAADLAALDGLRSALEESLGMKFRGDTKKHSEQGEHFFRSSLVQTLYYGVFSAWVLWARGRSSNDPSKFDWKHTADLIHVPSIQSLFHQLSNPRRLKSLDLEEPLSWTADVLNRVERAAFLQVFDHAQAVQHFYEPFLEEFDPELRKQLGVWYTPREVVQYMVARVDAVLRSELDITDGLADPRVYVLDPCTGTGSYLVEVLRKIHETLKSRGDDALVAQDVKKAAIERVFGFEIMPAPFVVAHMQVGLFLQTIGASLSDSNSERAGVYLTNALTGWEPPEKAKKQAAQALLTNMPELLEERDHASEVKRETPILVVIGNPPYNAFAGTSPEEEKGLVEPYKEGLVKTWGIKKFNLDDLYVRFFRLAERRIADMTGRGVISFISNSSYLDDPSFVVMRKRLHSEFDSLWFDNMNGDSRETGKRTPDGKPDPSVFSTDRNTAGIRVGTAICVFARKQQRDTKPVVRYREFWGASKRADLVASLSPDDFHAAYEPMQPDNANRFSFRHGTLSSSYLSWPLLPQLSATPPLNGLME